MRGDERIQDGMFSYVSLEQRVPSDHPLRAGGGNVDEGEHIEVLELPFDESYKSIESGPIQDGKTTMLLQYAALHLFAEAHATH